MFLWCGGGGEGYKLVPHHTNLLNSMTLQTLSSQIPFKIRNLTDFKAFFLDMLTEFHLLVPVKIWKNHKASTREVCLTEPHFYKCNKFLKAFVFKITWPWETTGSGSKSTACDILLYFQILEPDPDCQKSSFLLLG